MVKRYGLQVIVLVTLLMLLAYGFNTPISEFSYIEFLTHKLVLSVGVAFAGICTGYLIKNFLLVMLSTTFVLAIYCLAFIFDSKHLFPSFFLAIYTVFLGFAAIANLARGLQVWILSNE